MTNDQTSFDIAIAIASESDPDPQKQSIVAPSRAFGSTSRLLLCKETYQFDGIGHIYDLTNCFYHSYIFVINLVYTYIIWMSLANA